MAIKTLDLLDLEDNSDNVYEACLVIAKRAREINAGRIAERKEKEVGVALSNSMGFGGHNVTLGFKKYKK